MDNWIKMMPTTTGGTPTYLVYLAGPDVFLYDAGAASYNKRKDIEEWNKAQNWGFKLEGIFPLDGQEPPDDENPESAQKIYETNIELMDRCHVCLANMVRFRGPGMDGGTAFEMGYMKAQGKPVFGYYEAQPFYGIAEYPGDYYTKTRGLWHLGTDKTRDRDGLLVENFGQFDNLMLVGCVDNRGNVPRSFSVAVHMLCELISEQTNPQGNFY